MIQCNINIPEFLMDVNDDFGALEFAVDGIANNQFDVEWKAVGVGVLDELILDIEVVGDTHSLPFAELR